MKKELSILSVIVALVFSLVNTGCKKEPKDTTNPVVRINGLATCYPQRGRVYY